MKNEKKIVAFAIAFVVTAVGVYNSIMINSESGLGEASFVKRLDEMTGVITPGRKIANVSTSWKKIPQKAAPIVKANQEIQKTQPAPVLSPEAVRSAVSELQGDLELSLVEVINPKLWEKGLQVSQFSGSLSSSDGIISSISVSLPNGETISISHTEINGNVFEYSINGEVLSGMMYQVDQNSFMISLANGPFEGTRMRFSSTNDSEKAVKDQEFLAETHEIKAQGFGEVQAPAENTEMVEPVNAVSAQNSSFKL